MEDQTPPQKISYEWKTPDELKAFFTETYTVFTSVQKIEQDSKYSHLAKWGDQVPLIPSQETMQYYHRVIGLYRNAIRDYLEKLQAKPEPDLSLLEKWQSIHTTLNLAEVLYFPADGRGAGVVGEELLHWLNSFDFSPTTEEGQEIAQAAVPYNHPTYWDYVYRCVLRGFHTSAASVLKSLSNHHSGVIQRVAQKAVQLLQTLPRSTSFTMEHEFIASHRAWVGAVRKVLSGLEQEMDDMEAEAGHTEESEDERLEYEAQFRCLLELMAGVKDRIFEACEDWREALGAWGTLVQPSLKRDDIPDTMDIIFEKFPFDGTIAAEVVQAHLTRAEITKAVARAKDIDLWLAAHFCDLVDKAGLLEHDTPTTPTTTTGPTFSSTESNVRKNLILQYAQTMIGELGLWRISIDYLAVCGTEGRKKMRQVILSVPVMGPGSKKPKEIVDNAMDEDEADTTTDSDDTAKDHSDKLATDDFERVHEILRACEFHGLESEARVVCKRLSRTMTKERRYGVAVAYCVRAGDAVQIRKIADQMLEEYVSHGAERYVEMVDSIPSSLLSPTGEFDDADAIGSLDYDLLGESDIFGFKPARGFFSKRLAFLIRYRDFHKLYTDGQLRAAAQLLVWLITSEAAPERFLAVLLVDMIPILEADEQLLEIRETFELMRIVEQVLTAVASHPDMAEHYLGLLNQLVGASSEPTSASTQKASDKLDVVRLGLARHLARVSVAEMGAVAVAMSS